MLICADCKTELKDNSSFCSYCGTSQIIVKDNKIDREYVFTILGWLYSLNLILCLLVKFISSFQELSYYLLFDGIMSVITIVFIAITFKDIKDSLKWNNFSLKRLILYIIIAILFSTGVHFLVGLFNRNLFDEDYYYYFSFSGTSYPMIFMLLMVAVQPAIIEELGFRGLVMSQLNRIIDYKQVIFISAFLFALIHLSIFSMIWIIPFAIFLGYVREKENTIWYGVVIHFMFNATSCILEFYQLDLLPQKIYELLNWN